MSSVDDRIVNMQFNNKQFQAGAAESTKSLETLEKTINGMSGGQGLTNMGNGVDGIRGKFSALQVAGVTAIATIVNKAVNAGLTLLKSFTLEPVMQGFAEYETNLNSIQTIMANTGKGVDVVNKYLQELNNYSDLTIYNFSQMASSIGKFTAAGVKIDVATVAIKGMANTAALSGSNVQQLNTAMYQMSQALSTGVIRLMDWNSLANAGMGGENIRKALIETNRSLDDNGAAMDAAIAKHGNFRDSLREGWLTSETFTKAMEVMAGTTDETGKTVAFTTEELRKMGYSKNAAKELNKLSQAAIESATKVKTFSQLIDVVKESIGSGWARIFQDLFGNFNEATKMWTSVSEAITGAVGNIFNSVHDMLVGWRELGGFQDLWSGFANIFTALSNVVSPFVAAFKSLMPETRQAGSGLAKVTSAFANFTGWLVKITEGASVLTPILTSVFGVFKDVGAIAGSVFSALAPLVDLFSDLASSLGGLVKQGAEVGSGLIAGILEGFNPEAIKMEVEKFATNIVTWIKNALGIHSPSEETVPIGESIVQGIIVGIQNAIKFLFTVIATVSSAIAQGFRDMFGGMDSLDWTAFFNAILTGGLLLSLRSFTKTLKSFTVDLKGILDTVTGPFNQLTDTLKTMQTALKANILKSIAIAVALLAGSLIALSFVDPEKLVNGLGALGAVLVLLTTTMHSLAGIDAKSKEGLVGVAGSMVLISAAILTLTGAIIALGKQDMDTLEKGMASFAVSLTIMVLALQNLAGIGAGLPAAASAMLIMAGAITILAGAIAILGNMDPETLFQGMGAVAVSLLLFVTAINTLSGIGPGVAAASAGILIMAGAMVVMAKAVQMLGKMKPDKLINGITVMAIGLGLFVVALAALSGISAQVMVAAQAIFIVSAAMVILAHAIGILGAMDGGDLAKGLAAIAVALGIFLLAALAASAPPVAAGLIVLGTSLALIGAGAALFGVGLLAAATALTIFATIGSIGIAAIMAGLTALMALMPTFAMQLATSLVVFIETIAKMAPRLREAFGVIIDNILGTIEDAIPDIMDLASTLITEFLGVVEKYIPAAGKVLSAFIAEGLRVLSEAVPDFVIAGVDIILGIIEGLSKRVNRIITAGTELVVNFITGLGQAGKEIGNACLSMILDFLRGIRAAIEFYGPQIAEEGRLIAGAIIDGLTGGILGDGVRLVQNAITQLAQAIPEPIRRFLGIDSPSKVAHWWGEMIVEGLVRGISENVKNAVGAVVALANAIVVAGDQRIAAAQTAARKRQLAANKAAARAAVSDQLAKKAEKAADKDPDNKALEKKAKEARKLADKQAKQAEKEQEKADAAADAVAKKKEFNEADDVGKGDILTEKAEDLSARAARALAKANAEAEAAKKLSGKERKEMLKRAKESAALAKRLAKEAEEADAQAQKYYARSVEERIKTLNDEKKAREDQAAFDKATPAQQADILTKKAETARKLAESQRAQVEALLKKAEKVSKTDAREAQRLLDQAEKLADEADKNAADAKSYADQAKQITNSPDGPAGIQISKSVLEQAASAVDRYSESLAQAELAARAAPTEVQFIQHNYSPEALSAIEIYRQTGNLISLAEIKMGAN